MPAPPLFTVTLPNGERITAVHDEIVWRITKALIQDGRIKENDFLLLTDHRYRIGREADVLIRLLGWRYIVNEGEVDIAIELVSDGD